MPLNSLYGPLVLPDWPEDLIVRCLQRFGEWGATESRLCGDLLPEGAVLWDCGAFVGTFTLGVARHKPLASVVAIEANPLLEPFLHSNLSRLARCPVSVVAAGVASKEGALQPREHLEVESNHGAQAYDLGPPGTGPIPCHTLKALRARLGDYTALKLDLEGMEVEAIKGDYSYIKQTKPTLWIECNETLESLDSLSALKSLGYDPVYLAFPAFRQDNYKGVSEIPYPFAYEAALFAASPERLAVIDWSASNFSGVIVRPVETRFQLRQALFDTPRWGRHDWQKLSRIELVARLTRALSGTTLAEFLR